MSKCKELDSKWNLSYDFNLPETMTQRYEAIKTKTDYKDEATIFRIVEQKWKDGQKITRIQRAEASFALTMLKVDEKFFKPKMDMLDKINLNYYTELKIYNNYNLLLKVINNGGKQFLQENNFKSELFSTYIEFNKFKNLEVGIQAKLFKQEYKIWLSKFVCPAQIYSKYIRDNPADDFLALSQTTYESELFEGHINKHLQELFLIMKILTNIPQGTTEEEKEEYRLSIYLEGIPQLLMSLLSLTTHDPHCIYADFNIMVLDALVTTCRMNPLAIGVIISDEFSLVRKQLLRNFEEEWKIALSDILEPVGTNQYLMMMSDDILFKLVEYLDSIVDKTGKYPSQYTKTAKNQDNLTINYFEQRSYTSILKIVSCVTVKHIEILQNCKIG